MELPTMCVAVRLVDERLTVDAQALACPGLRHAGCHATSHDRILFECAHSWATAISRQRRRRLPHALRRRLLDE
ncbi:MAG: hypothetical protein ACLTYW_00610 [Collinsella sp.]